MNGAESLVRTLVASEVEVCFTNPGTSEMHFVAALDKVEGMRCVLGMFEGVVTGAADGYYRMKGKPAATLLHLGPGLGNGLANLHNAKKARSGIVNIVGEHASYHIRHDAPLTSDIEGVARPMSDWVRTSKSARDVAADGARAVEAARTAPGQIATLILPADTAWNESDGPSVARAPAPRTPVSADMIKAAATALKHPGAALLLGGAGVHGRALEWAGRIAAATGDGPVDAVFHAIRQAVPHESDLRLFQVHAVTEGTDAQAQVSVRLEEDGRIATGQAADTDTLTASAKAYVNALNNLFARKEKTAPEAIASGF